MKADMLILKENNSHPAKANGCNESTKNEKKVINIDDDDEAPTYAQKTAKKSIDTSGKTKQSATNGPNANDGYNSPSHVLVVGDSHIII